MTRVIKSFFLSFFFSPHAFLNSSTRDKPLEWKRIHRPYPSPISIDSGNSGGRGPVSIVNDFHRASWCIRAKPETFVDFSLRWKRRRFVRKHLASPSYAPLYRSVRSHFSFDFALLCNNIGPIQGAFYFFFFFLERTELWKEQLWSINNYLISFSVVKSFETLQEKFCNFDILLRILRKV